MQMNLHLNRIIGRLEQAVEALEGVRRARVQASAGGTSRCPGRWACAGTFGVHGRALERVRTSSGAANVSGRARTGAYKRLEQRAYTGVRGWRLGVAPGRAAGRLERATKHKPDLKQ
ncbi:hypothetical protein CRG98_035277 [Punica granatum]|uniref:Uncharacterized protein n=1 Tax=Punica granatum TaxID=22663 RepID=A0A2I0ILV8_PUNGR|nr:hypothetical protein CRG98_035277 [Punica granatum]